MFHCIAWNASFDSRSGLGNHKQHWGCSDNSDSNVVSESNHNSNHASSVVVNNNIVNDDNRNCKRSRNYAENEIDTESVMANTFAHNKPFTMMFDIMENYESCAVADGYDNVLDCDYDDFVVNDNEDMDNISKDAIEETSINNSNKDVIPEDNNFERISSNTLMILQKTAETTERSTLSTNIIAGIELMAILRSCGASLNLYDKIVSWLENRIPHNLTECLPTREKVIKMMEQHYNLKCLAPVKTQVVLPSINLPVEIPVNPMLGCIFSLLSDESIMRSKNLIFPNANDPSQVTAYNGKYSEINSGLAYQSFQQSVQTIRKAVPVPLIFFIDGTAIDRACRHSQTPVMMTLGIFNQSLRNKSVAWRNVGFVKNNVKEQYSQQQIDAASRLIWKYPRNHECYVPDNHNDWHTQIRCIMNDLLRIQKKKRFEMVVHYR